MIIMAKRVLMMTMMMISSPKYLGVSARQYILEANIPSNQATAEQFCVQQYGTHLATILNLQDQLKVEEVLTALPNGPLAVDNEIYFGLNDITVELFLNKTGRAFTSGITQGNVEFWAANEPSDPALDCTILDRTKTGVNGATIPWADRGCDSQRRFVCDDADAPRFILVLDQKLTFNQAQAFCQSAFNSNLASVLNGREQKLLEGLMGNNDLWIGMNNVNQSNFLWTSKLNPSFFGFGDGQPDRAAGANCVEAVGRTTAAGLQINAGSWNDQQCGKANNFVCDGNFAAVVGGVVSIPPDLAPVANDGNDDNAPPADNSVIIIAAGAGAGGAMLLIILAIVLSRRRAAYNNNNSTLAYNMSAASPRSYFRSPSSAPSSQYVQSPKTSIVNSPMSYSIQQDYAPIVIPPPVYSETNNFYANKPSNSYSMSTMPYAAPQLQNYNSQEQFMPAIQPTGGAMPPPPGLGYSSRPIYS